VSRRLILVGLASCCLLTAALYLAWSFAVVGELGFSLDDGWIHQVFARNLVETGQMAYNPGEPAAGSTAPLWTLLLAVGRFVNLEPRLWAYALGLGFLAAAGYATYLLWRALLPGLPLLGGVAAAFVVVMDWHLTWAAVSGMETTLFVLFAVLLATTTMQRRPPWVSGLLAGLLFVTRPEGILLGGLCWIYGVTSIPPVGSPGGSVPGRGNWVRRAMRFSAVFAVGLMLPVLPYLAFDLATSGTLLPNTYYAKGAVYGRDGLRGLLGFFGEAFAVLSMGPLALLLPGIVTSAVLMVRQRRDLWLVLAWPVVLLVVYAWRLPRVYQYGRYLMPMLPFLTVLGWWGLSYLREKINIRQLSILYPVTVALLTAFTWFYGADVYASDVRYIQTFQVTTARWLRDNTPPNALVATHDIGAIGYFSERRVLDSAGLVTPQVLPLLNDQPRLLAYLKEQRVAYVAQFPLWYPLISRDLADREVFRVRDEKHTADGGDYDFVVYRTGW
jgi:arabinofuranosyltransferase